LGILAKLDSVIQPITSSAAKRSEFKVWCTKLDYNGPSLIVGHGIRWNIKWESRDRAFKACKVIEKLIENEKDRQECDGGENFFREHEISRREWDVVKRLNDILGVSPLLLDLQPPSIQADMENFAPGVLFYY
jgi:hypothetical protein